MSILNDDKIKEQLNIVKKVSKKRRRDNNDNESIDFIDVSNKIPKLNNNNNKLLTRFAFIAPWARRSYRARHFLQDLHEEILDFCAFVSPTAIEQNRRRDVIKRIENVTSELWPNSNLEVFGSFATRLYLPMSDLDLVLFRNTSQIDEHQEILEILEEISRWENIKELSTKDRKKLKQLRNRHRVLTKKSRRKKLDKRREKRQLDYDLNLLADTLRDRGMVTYIETITSAKVPIIKFTDKESGIAVDICMDIGDGLKTAKFMVEFQRHFPALRPLTLVLKYFLVCRDLCETYQGGVGSFLLQLMIISHLQHLHSNSKHLKQMNLGSLLYSFFEFYGESFNYSRVGISVNDGGSFFKKMDRGWYNPQRPELLSMENPLDKNHDVGTNSYHIARVRKSFQFAQRMLSTSIDANDANVAPTLLSRLVTVTKELADYRPLTEEQQQLSAQLNSLQSTHNIIRTPPPTYDYNNNNNRNSKRSSYGSNMNDDNNNNNDDDDVDNVEPFVLGL